MEALADCRLFSGLDPDGRAAVAADLRIRTERFARGALLVNAAECLDRIGIVLEGEVEASRQDAGGGLHLIDRFRPLDVFGEGIAFSESRRSPVVLVAKTAGRVAWLDAQRLLDPDAADPRLRIVLLANLLRGMSQRNQHLNLKLDLTGRRTTRARVCAYLLHATDGGRSTEIRLPYDRAALADYLGVNRSALSTVLSGLRADGVISFRRAEFRLLDPAALVRHAEGQA